VRRGRLRVYLGAAPGVGKTFAMLEEGTRRRDRGADVVVGYVEAHERAQTLAALGDLEVVPRQVVTYRGVRLEEMDLDAVLARAPEIVLVDEAAHTNAPGGRHERRWQDIEDLLDAGIDVLSTVNVQHLESLNDVVAEITGVEQHETVPDAFVRGADQIHFVDQTPEALRRRMAHGNIYPPERVDAALANFFRPGNLSALRELALMWVADRVDDELRRYREAHGIDSPWETRERVVVALTGAPTGDDLVRRAARLADRARGDLVGVHVRAGDGVAAGRLDQSAGLDRQKRLLLSLDGSFREVSGADVAESLVRAARAAGATQLVLGASARSRWRDLVSGSIVNEVIRRSGPIDVHVMSHSRPGPDDGATGLDGALPEAVRQGLVRVHPATFGRRRIVWSWVLALVVPPLATALMDIDATALDRSSKLLVYTLGVAAIALVGGVLPATVAAVASFLLANWFFTAPYHTFTISAPEHLISLVTFLGVAAIIGFYVSVAARRSLESVRFRSEAETLAAMAGAMGSSTPLATLAEQVRFAFAARSVAVLRESSPDGGGGAWELVAAAGSDPPTDPTDSTASAPLGDTAVLALRGDHLRDLDSAVFAAFCANLGAALERERLDTEAAKAERLAETEQLRSGLLSAVSHDLRTPLAAIKAASSTLMRRGANWPEDVRDELVASIDQQADRLSSLVSNLLTMSRIQSSAVQLDLVATEVADVAAAALSLVDARGHRVTTDLDGCPPVLADPQLLERVVGNLVDNACKWSPPGAEVRLDAHAAGESVVIRVVDSGPGIPRDRRGDAFVPFQRLGDSSGVEGTGLGLAIAHGFAEAMSGTIEIEDTPGGGTTMVLTLPSAVVAEPAAEPAVS
jgi:two-component system sensor histidine kinase KdpD